MELVELARQGNRRAMARLISLLENEEKGYAEAVKKLFPFTGRAHVVGITGPPGSGKSTLTHKLVKELRKKGGTAAVVAVDPTSSFTGGAILGDRVRMSDLSLDEGVFIRSMGTRGRLGGLSKAVSHAVRVFDACGFDFIFIETVGVGQSEIDIVKTADTILVVAVPGLGDDIQAIKAGILEIGDIFVVNKADREGANRVKLELESMLDLNPDPRDWRPPVLLTVAPENSGVANVLAVVDKHVAYLKESGSLEKRRRERLAAEVTEIMLAKISRYIMIKLEEFNFTGDMERLMKKDTDPYTLADEVLSAVLRLSGR